MEQKVSYAKSKQATEPQTSSYAATIGGYIVSGFHAIPLHSLRVMEKFHQNIAHHKAVRDDLYHTPLRLYGPYFALLLLLTGRCYDTETSAILLLLKWAFARITFCIVLERSSFHQILNETKGYSSGVLFLWSEKKC